MIVSLFKTVTNPHDIQNPAHTEAIKVLRAIGSGRWKDQVNEIRSQTTKDGRDELKRKLPAVLFAGKFSSRRVDGFIESSGLLPIDFDGLPQEDIQSLRETLQSKPWVLSVFVSPSGKGLKAIVKTQFDTDTEYKSVFCAIDNELGQLESFDLQNSDISRACFVSYDPNIYINENPSNFTGYIDKYEEYLKRRRLNSPEKIYDVLTKWMDKSGYSYQPGQRNHYLFVLAAAMCRYGVQEDATHGLFLTHYTDINRDELKSVIESAYKRNEFGKVNIADLEPSQDTAFYKNLEVPDFEFDPRSVLVSNDEINQGVFDIARGKKDFQSFGLPALDKYLVLKKREMYAFVAGGKAGKTLLMSYLVLMAAKYAGWRFILLTTETEIKDFKATMVNFLVNGHLDKTRDKDIAEALEFIDQHVTFIENDLDHLQIFDVYHYEKTQGNYYDCIVVDPITNIEESKQIKGYGNDYYRQLYIEYLKFTKKYCATWIISHTVSQKEREHSAPYIQDAEYGVHLFRRCHYGVALHRDMHDEIDKNKVEAHIRAVRTAITRGGGVTMNNDPVEFHLNIDSSHFGYNIVVDGHGYKNPLIFGDQPEKTLTDPGTSHYEKEPKEIDPTDGFRADTSDEEESPF